MEHEQRKKALVEYLKSKIAEEDWHGVSDAANDLRVLEAKIEPQITLWVEAGIEIGPLMQTVEGKKYREIKFK